MSHQIDAIGWTDEVVGSLRQLWNEGHSTAEIGRRIGVSKNAVVGKAHPLDLPNRPSPIRQDGAPRPPRRPPAPRLADIMPMTNAVMVLATPPPHHPRTPPQRTPPPAPRTTPAPRTPTPTTTAAVGNKPCCWRIGEPGTREFRFCDAPALVNKPYCDEHAQLAYRRIPRREEDDRTAVAD